MNIAGGGVHIKLADIAALETAFSAGGIQAEFANGKVPNDHFREGRIDLDALKDSIPRNGDDQILREIYGVVIDPKEGNGDVFAAILYFKFIARYLCDHPVSAVRYGSLLIGDLLHIAVLHRDGP